MSDSGTHPVRPVDNCFGLLTGRDKILRELFQRDSLTLRDVLHALHADRLGFVWNLHLSALPVSCFDGAELLVVPDKVAVLLSADGRVLGFGAPRERIRSCARAFEMDARRNAQRTLPSLEALLQEMWPYSAKPLQSRTWRGVLRYEIRPERVHLGVGDMGEGKRP